LLNKKSSFFLLLNWYFVRKIPIFVEAFYELLEACVAPKPLKAIHLFNS